MAATRSSSRGRQSGGRERPGSGTASRARQRVRDTAEQGSEQVKEQANGATGSLTGEILGSFSDAAKDILGPAVQQMSAQAAERAAAFARERGPALVKDELLPKVMESAGVDNPGDLAKMGIGRAGEMISGAGGITGVAGKLMSKLGGGKGGGNATGWGQKRRMPVQQDVFVSVAVEDAYRGWTEYKRWSEYVHRANLVDPQPEEDSFRLKVTEKMWGFKRPFTAEVVSQKPNHHIRWRSTEGTKHVGVIAFHSLGEHLTLISVNIDHAPSGLLVERMARGFRFSKRAIRADLHRFKGWIEHKSDDEIAEIEGWLGTIEGGQVTVSHEDGMERMGVEPSDSDEGDDGEEQEQPDDIDERDDEDEEPSDREENGYEEMSMADLREELRAHGLPTRGRRETLLDRLREADHDDDDEEAEGDEDEEGQEEQEAPRRRARSRR
jgi:uncharacterized membrane protein